MAFSAYRKILHLDLDAFFCAVEALRNPDLQGKPFAVGGSPDRRGVVSSCSYAARAFGVHSAMPMSQALRVCPDLVVVRHGGGYGRASKEVMARLRELTPLVQQISVDEAFLDVSDLPQSLLLLAQTLQARIQDELSLPCSLGGASNKLVAKIANTMGKSQVRTSDYPRAVTIVPAGQEAAFLAPLPVRALWGVGTKTEARLHALGLHTIGELAAVPEREMMQLLGQHGYELSHRARGIDNRPVTPARGAAKSISSETTFAHDVQDATMLRATLRRLAMGVAKSLRRKGYTGRTVRLKLRLSDFTTLTRQSTLPRPTDDERIIVSAVLRLFEKVWVSGQPVRLLGAGVSNLQKDVVQLKLWEEKDDRVRKLQSTIDALQERYGEASIHRGVEE